MAIEKTVFTATVGPNRLSELRNWLAENATDYFDTITEISSNTFYCKKNSKNVLAFKNNGQNDNISTYLSNTTSKDWRSESTFNANYAVKTSKGILIHFPSDASATSFPTNIFVTKTQNDGLAIAVPGTSYASTDFNEYCVADFEQTPSWSYYVKTTKNAEGLSSFKNQLGIEEELTVLLPIPCHGSPTYCVGLFQARYTQYPAIEGIITANGKNYYSNGYFALEE